MLQTTILQRRTRLIERLYYWRIVFTWVLIPVVAFISMPIILIGQIISLFGLILFAFVLVGLFVVIIVGLELLCFIIRALPVPKNNEQRQQQSPHN